MSNKNIFIFSIIYYVLFSTKILSNLSTSAVQVLYLVLVQIISINIGLGVFNLIPLPPLDGEKIFRNLLPYKAQRWLQDNYATLSAIFMILWFVGVLDIIVYPIVSTITDAMLVLTEKLFAMFF